MKVKFGLTMRRDGVGAACSFDADINWLSLDPINDDKMKDFKPTFLTDLSIIFEDGSALYFRPDYIEEIKHTKIERTKPYTWGLWLVLGIIIILALAAPHR